MARVTVEDCLENMDNRFQLVLVATKRARQLALGSDDPSLPWDNDKPTVVALREIAEGHVDASILNEVTAAEHAQESLLDEEELIAEAAIEQGEVATADEAKEATVEQSTAE